MDELVEPMGGLSSADVTPIKKPQRCKEEVKWSKSLFSDDE